MSIDLPPERLIIRRLVFPDPHHLHPCPPPQVPMASVVIQTVVLLLHDIQSVEE